MSFDWIDFLSLAESLYDNPQSPGPEEASWRSSASRAYYAAFQMVLHFAKAQTGYEERLRLNRRQADYDDVLKQHPRKLAEGSVLAAKYIVELMEREA